MSPEAPDVSGATPRRRRWLRLLWWVSGAGAVLIALALVGLSLVLAHLDGPFVKTRVRQLAREKAGVELDYRAATGTLWRGISVDELTIQTPAELATFSPKLLRIGAVDVRWSLRRLLFGPDRIDAIAVSDVELVIVLDHTGRTSFDFPTTEAPDVARAAEPPRPLSRLLDDLLLTPLPLRSLRLDPVKTTVLRTKDHTILQTIAIDGVRATVTTGPAASGEAGGRGTKIALDLGTRDQPLELWARDLGKAPDAPAGRARLWVAATAQPGRATLAVDLRLVEQNLLPKVKVDRALALEAALTFDARGQRVLIAVPTLSVADGALVASAQLEQPDTAAALPKVVRLDGIVAVPRLLERIPKAIIDTLPSIGEGTLEVHATQIQLGAVPQLLAGGEVSLKGTLGQIRYDGFGARVRAPRLLLDVTGTPDRTLRGRVKLELDEVQYRAGKHVVTLGEGALDLRATKLAYDASGAKGSFGVDATLRRVDVESGALGIHADGLALGLDTLLTTAPPYGAKVTLGATKLALLQKGRPRFADAVAIELGLRDVVPNVVAPQRSTGAVKLTGTLGGIKLDLDAAQRKDGLTYTLALDAQSLAALEPLVGDALTVPWRKVGVLVRSSGRAVGLWGPLAKLSIQHDSRVELTQPAIEGPAGKLAASRLVSTLSSSGSTRKHDGALAVTYTGLARNGMALGDGELKTTLSFDAAVPRLHVQLTSAGKQTPSLHADVDVGFERKTRVLSWRLELSAAQLGGLQPLASTVKQLAGFSLPGLSLRVDGKGTLAGVVESIDADGVPTIEPRVEQLVGQAEVGVDVTGLSWRQHDRTIATPHFIWRGALAASGDRKALKSDLDLDELHVAIGPQRFDVSDLTDDLEVVLVGEPRLLQIELKDKMAMGAFRQDVLPSYPMAKLQLALDGERTRDGVIRIRRLHLENGAAGTRVDLKGGLDLGEDRRSLSLRGSLEQKLETVWNDRRRFAGSGTLRTELQLSSGDLRLYRTRAAVKLKEVNLSLPAANIKLEAVDGEIPIDADVVFGPKGPRLLKQPPPNSYAELRFVDQLPMASRSSYLTIAKIDTPYVSIAPLAGNLEIKQNLISLSQLELGVRGGRVAGRAALEYKGPDSIVQLAVRATHVLSSRGEPFDGNASLELAARQQSVQGRAEILRIGRRHLLDLLDLVDPPRADAAINKVRRALQLGYPEEVRLSFSRGFASARITFGGLAKLVRLDEIRGIPLGPILSRVIDPLLGDEE